MNIALTGPRDLSEFDKKDIQNYINTIAQENEISILAYRSIEVEVFKFYISNPELAEKLTIYTFQNIDELPETLNKSIRFLISQGAKYRSLNFEKPVVKRDDFINAWQKILERCDSVVSFYDNEKLALMIPIDEAKIMKKKAIVYNLPGINADRYNLPLERKMRNVE